MVCGFRMAYLKDRHAAGRELSDFALLGGRELPTTSLRLSEREGVSLDRKL